MKRLRVIIDRERCKGCALCVTYCGRKKIVMSRQLNAKGSHYASTDPAIECSGCMNCAEVCPDAAIAIDQVAEPSGVEALARGEATGAVVGAGVNR
jgi:2-oxoglutarate ferredoxin oxidoreductase subunit delta